MIHPAMRLLGLGNHHNQSESVQRVFSGDRTESRLDVFSKRPFPRKSVEKTSISTTLRMCFNLDGISTCRDSVHDKNLDEILEFFGQRSFCRDTVKKSRQNLDRISKFSRMLGLPGLRVRVTVRARATVRVVV